MEKITNEVITSFLNGKDPLERIVNIECGFDSDTAFVIYINEKGEKRIRKEQFKPFVWVKHSAAIRMFKGDRKVLRKKMLSYGINIVKLTTTVDGTYNERLEDGFKYMFKATRPMSFQTFGKFFTEAGTPIYAKKRAGEQLHSSDKEILSVSPVEQFMISTGKRLFKGYENYDDVKRMLFDIETTGLNPKVDSIEQIGVRTNKGFETLISVDGTTPLEKQKNERAAIIQFVKIIAAEKPDVIAGHNSENFDWDFIITRSEILGLDFHELTMTNLGHPIYKLNKDVVLKLGGETEYYKPTVLWGYSIVDSLHAVRRAQAIDSNMELANLKYVTKYLNLNKTNRVYVKGDIISKVWNENEPVFELNDTNGDWRRIENGTVSEGYTAVTGRYIVERYLLDDIWETDKVELTLNESNFLVSKMVPTNFSRACTMGTAGIWKLIMLAWCYENKLGVPSLIPRKRFTGGLSRLLKTGYVDNIVKLDYNSLYPSIILTWHVSTPIDITNAMLYMLDYVLTQREHYKELKGEAGKKANELKDELEKHIDDREYVLKLKELINHWKSAKSSNDKKQLPLKIFANSFFGSYGAPNIFPFGDAVAAEKVTCIGRMALRLMISHFSNIGYEPIVGDTDGFNFQMPKTFRYTEDNPYIGKGLGRNTVSGKAYTGVDADVAEFEDMFMSKPYNGGVNKMGLGVDEFCTATINFARKNYADLMPDGSVKKVGNTVKSRKMSGYLKKFMDSGIDLLLHGKGKEFLDSYYKYIYKIYNYQIPVQDIASKGKIKKSMEEYSADCKTVTKSGSKKSRQAWYELAIAAGQNPRLGETVYYINTGTKKSHTDVKRVTHKYMIDENGEEVEITGRVVTRLMKAECEKEGIDYKSLKTKDKNERIKKYVTREFDEILLNCRLIPTDMAESENEVLCSDLDDLEYNVEKYIDQFNKRVKTLLVCFHPDIRDRILIDNPKDTPYFTEAESQLVSGYPNKELDQDTYEALMTPERKEIEYWMSINEVPPFVEECGIDWDELLNKHKETIQREQENMFKVLNEKYIDALKAITDEDVEVFYEEGTVPGKISDLMFIDSSDMKFHFRDLPEMVPSTGGYVFDDMSCDKAELDDE